MKTRMVMHQEHPEAYNAMMGMEKFITSSTLDKTLLELIKIRASQINGCAFCINMHTRDARKNGESEKRIYALNAWRETPYFTDEERAVLALTEAMTLIAGSHVPDEVYNEAARHFSNKTLSEVIIAIITINGWNRLAIATGLIPD
jgi:AhpD family alkylhydroperoxidase